MSWDLDTKGDSFDVIDNGFRMPVGFYKAKLAEFKESQQDGSGEFTFQVTAGPFVGQKSDTKLYNPKFADTPEKTANAAKRAKVWAARLGLITEADLGKPVALDFKKAVGKDCVIKLILDSYKDNKTGAMREIVKIDYMGVYDLAHPDIPDDFRKEYGLPPARPKKGGGSGGGANGQAATTTQQSTTNANVTKSVDELAADILA